MNSTFFISYGDNNYIQSRKRIQLEATNMGFDNVSVYSPQDISESFRAQTMPFISLPSGGGYWLWKSFLLKQTFDKMKLDDICVYADAGCHINIHGKQRLQEYYDMVNSDESGILSFYLDHIEEVWTTEKLFEYFNIPNADIKIRKSSQYMAGIKIIKKCKSTIDLINRYYDIAVTQPDLFSDTHNSYKPNSVFRDHRHDQSVFSILRKQYGSVVIWDETCNPSNWAALKHIPILSTRIKC